MILIGSIGVGLTFFARLPSSDFDEQNIKNFTRR